MWTELAIDALLIVEGAAMALIATYKVIPQFRTRILAMILRARKFHGATILFRVIRSINIAALCQNIGAKMLECCGYAEGRTEYWIKKNLLASFLLLFLSSCFDIADRLSAEKAEMELTYLKDEREMIAIKALREMARDSSILRKNAGLEDVIDTETG